ncbi:HlyD family type I secretion periplasmic adaptor subunit [Hoeflea sp. YIM 152468]|uniref:HlyD family type I secretion periplasmic adaptor subunit n=1 Tax=Hoeflea sp. YIM 152468 TaxID=3031759 RepID=UPI0023DC4321|nr:HlyD family type I secretion periplasmic adaptor subunit [Hoeflea sp. YIM 152468]MDF1610098.1 HlyD family type I secretion periplasmic adaptor subunit [Hoeflea sp. YIM 152468]
MDHDTPPIMSRFIVWICLLSVISFVLWSAWATVDEISRGDGKVIPLSKTQIVQSSEPGVVQEIAVTVGQIVKKGDLLIRLDSSGNLASLGESEARYDALQARVARLELEIDGLFDTEFVCPERTRRVSGSICSNEASLLAARRENYLNKLQVLQARRQQRLDEIGEAKSNVAQTDLVIRTMMNERGKIAPLVKRKLHPEIDLLRLDREIAQQQGQRENVSQSLKRLDSALHEAELQIQELDSQFKQEARRELGDTLADVSVLQATLRGAEDRVRRTDIVSPVDGIVNTLEVNTIGAFLQPGSVVAGVVPVTETLLVEARISPKDVAFVQPGQKALVKLTAYDFSIYGGLEGSVSNISADSIVNPETGETYYQVLVQTGNSQIGKGHVKHAIRPGMIASVEILTGEKTVLDYLMKPVSKARYEALTER